MRIGALLLAGLAMGACVLILIMWPPTCETSRNFAIGHAMLLSGCDRR